MMHDFNVLARGVKHFQHAFRDHQLEEGARSRPGARLSIRSSVSPAAIWIRQSLGQNVCSRMNSVSMAIKGAPQSGASFGEVLGCGDEVHGAGIA